MHLGFAVDGFAVERQGQLIVGGLAFQALHEEIEDIVSDVTHLHGMVLAEGLVEQFDGLSLIDGRGKCQTDVVVHFLVGGADGLHGDKAEVLAAYAEAELQHLVGSDVNEVGHLEPTDIVLVLVDVVVLEADGVFVDPHGLTLQGGCELEGLGGDGLAEFHLQVFGVAEAHHDGLAGSDDARGVAVEHGQHGLIQLADAFHKHIAVLPLLAARGQQGKQQQAHNQADAADSFQIMHGFHIIAF